MTGDTVSDARLERVILDEDVPTNLPPFIEADREQAVADLMRRINEDVGFGRSSVKQGAQAFIDQGNALLRRA